MVFKNLGASGRQVSAIGLGTGGAFGNESDSDLIKLVRSAIDLGINFFDTAEGYFNGRSEIMLGKALKGLKDKVTIASKFSPDHSSEAKLVKALDGTLARLKRDYVDIYQVHWPNLDVPLEETLGTLERQVKKGKIKYIGVSNFSLKKIKKSVGLLKSYSLASVQNEYNFSERSVEAKILPFCKKYDVTFIAYNPLSSGFPIKNKRQSRIISKLSKKYKKSEAQIVLNWLISKDNVIAIPGTTSHLHLLENAGVTSFLMESSDLDLFDKSFEQVVHLVPLGMIEVYDDNKTYLSLDEALRNKFKMVPSPLELSREIKAGDFLKPIKLKRIVGKSTERYQLSGGKIRFWAWRIAFGNDRPIPAVIE